MNLNRSFKNLLIFFFVSIVSYIIAWLSTSKTIESITLIVQILALLFAFVTVNKSNVLLKIFIFIAPLYYLPSLFFPQFYFSNLGGIEIPILKSLKDIFWGIIAILGIIYVFFTGQIFTNLKLVLNNQINRMILYFLSLFLFICLILGFVNSFGFYDLDIQIIKSKYLMGLRTFLEYSIATLFIYIFIHTEKQLKNLLKIILISLVGVIVFGFFQLIFGHSIYGYGGGISRIYSTMLKPTNLGNFMSMCLIIMIPIYFNYIKPYKGVSLTLIFKSIIISSFFIMFAAISMSGIISCVLGLVIVSIFLNKDKLAYLKKINFKAVIASFLVLNISTAILISNNNIEFKALTGVSHRIDSLFNNNDKSTNIRKNILGDYVEEASKETIYINMFGKGTFYESKSKEKTDKNVYDNSFILLHNNFGFTGLAVFFFIIIFSMVKTYKVYSYSNKPFIKSLTLGIFAYLASSLFSNYYLELYFSYFPINMYFWIILGIILLLGTKIQYKELQKSE